MKNRFVSFAQTLQGRIAIATMALATVTGLAHAEPADMPPIELPIDLASVAAAVAVVGGLMLLTWAGIFIGFKLAGKFIKRAGNTV